MDASRRCECSDVARMTYRACASDLRPTRRACEKGRFPGVGRARGLSKSIIAREYTLTLCSAVTNPLVGPDRDRPSGVRKFN